MVGSNAGGKLNWRLGIQARYAVRIVHEMVEMVGCVWVMLKVSQLGRKTLHRLISINPTPLNFQLVKIEKTFYIHYLSLSLNPHLLSKLFIFSATLTPDYITSPLPSPKNTL